MAIDGVPVGDDDRCLGRCDDDDDDDDDIDNDDDDGDDDNDDSVYYAIYVTTMINDYRHQHHP